MKLGTILKLIFTLLALGSLIYSSVPRAFAQPMPGCAFWGYVTIGGKPAPDRLNVTATIAGSDLSYTTRTKNGTYGWGTMGSTPLNIPSDGAVTGDTVEFYVNGTMADQTGVFVSGGAQHVDLSLSGPVLEQSELTVSLDCVATFVGYEVNISGKLAYPNGNGISAATLLASYSVNDGLSWNSIASFDTAANGDYHVEWYPTTTGNSSQSGSAMAGGYLVTVEWAGSENVEGAEASVNLTVMPLEEKYVFSVVSNSTISDLAYNSSSNALRFTLEGPSGTIGYVDITIAKKLIMDANGMRVYVDGKQIEYTTMASDDSYLLHFTYQHSIHEIIVDLSQPTQPFFETPLGIATLFGITAILIALIYIGRKRLRRPKETKLTKSNSESQKPGRG